MRVSNTGFERKYHYAKQAGSDLFGLYVHHFAEVSTTIKIDDYEYLAVYQTGWVSDYPGYHDYPSNTPSLTRDGRTSELVLLVSDYARDLHSLDGYISRVMQICPAIRNIDDLMEVESLVEDCNYGATMMFNWSENIDDYIIDEDGALKRKPYS